MKRGLRQSWPLLLTGLLLLTTTSTAEDAEWLRIDCGSGQLYFSVKAFPEGLPMSKRQICKCFRRRWRGAECEMGKKQKEWHEWAHRKNLEIMESIQPGSIRVGKGER